MKRKNFSDEFKQKVIDFYKNMESQNYTEVAKIFGIGQTTVSRWCSNYKKSPKIIRYSDEIKSKALSLYKQGMYAKDVGNAMNIKEGTIDLWINKAGISRHRGPKSKIGREDFFDKIDNEEKAYYLGWLMADGCMDITNGQYSIKIAVVEYDREIIDNFLRAIKANYTPSVTKSNKGCNNRVYVSITSRYMCEALLKFGIHPHKSGTEIIPDGVPEELMHHFIRGFFDGDGITNYSNNGKRKRTGFIATMNVLSGIQKRLGTNQKCHHPANTRKEVEIYYFLGGIEFSRKLRKYIYKDATVYLTRKKERLNLICGNTEIIKDDKKSLIS